MKSLSRDDLLRPSLQETGVAKVPYSLRVTFLTAFFGGPFAALAITIVNSVRLRRWLRDLAPLGLALAALLAFTLALYWTEWGAGLRASIDGANKRGIAYLYRVIGLLFFGLGTLLHRKEQRSAELMGLDRPNGWIAGLACLFGGVVLSVALAELVSAEQ